MLHIAHPLLPPAAAWGSGCPHTLLPLLLQGYACHKVLVRLLIRDCAVLLSALLL